MLKGALGHFELTYWYTKGLENERMDVWVQQGRQQGGGRVQSRKKTLCRDCGLGYEYQQSACDMLVTHVHGEVAPGVITRSSSLGRAVIHQRAPCVVLNSPLGTPEALRISTWMCGVARKAARRGESKAEKKTPHRDCGLGYEYQQRACNILVAHVHGEVTPGVVAQSGKVWEGPLYVEQRLGSFRSHLLVHKRP